MKEFLNYFKKWYSPEKFEEHLFMKTPLMDCFRLDSICISN